MKERPILFSAPMVRALLAGTKTQTRRVVQQELRPLAEGSDGYSFDHKGINYRVNARHTTVGAWAQLLQFCPYGRPGERLWVREAWRTAASLDHLNAQGIADAAAAAGHDKPWAPVQYEADGARLNWQGFGNGHDPAVPGRYRHGRFMPRWASRIALEVNEVRVERLQDISEADAVAEGCPQPPHLRITRPDRDDSARGWYRDLWGQINGAGSWDANPFVWVVEFRRAAA